MHRDDLFAYLDTYLASATFNDYTENGLQVEGREQIKRVAVAVSANLRSIEEAIAWQADALIVHHGFFWSKEPRSLRGFHRTRIKRLLEADLNLGAYHLPLDAHPEVGNNAVLAHALGLQVQETLPREARLSFGIIAAAPSPLDPQKLRDDLAQLCQPQLIAFLEGPQRIKRIGLCSGGAGQLVAEAAHLGLDAFITGEASETALAIAREAKLHFFAAGHHATERFGIKALATHIQERFHLTTRFFDADNPV